MEVNPNQGYYSLGQQTCKVPMILFEENRKRLADALRNNSSTPQNSVVLLQAGGEQGKSIVAPRTLISLSLSKNRCALYLSIYLECVPL